MCVPRDYLQQPVIVPGRAALFNAADAAVQAVAWSEGRSHAVAVQSARRHCGALVGLVNR